MNNDAQFDISRAAYDQNGERWAEVSKGNKSTWISLNRYGESDPYGTRCFTKIGVALLTSASKVSAKTALEKREPDENIFVVSMPGYVTIPDGQKVRYIGYAHASGELISHKQPNDPEVIIGFEPSSDFGHKGDHTAYQAVMGPLVKDQALPLLMLSLAMSPILQPFAPTTHYVENMVFDLCGRGSSLKSAIAVAIAGSVWGGSERKTGFFCSANATTNKIEQFVPMYNNALLGCDETTLMGDEARARGKAIGNLVHRISNGTTKNRMGDGDPQIFRMQAIFSSNQSLRSMSAETTNVVEAMETRIITLYVPERTTGAYDHLPLGFNTTKDVHEKLYALAKEHYGHIARLMIQKTLAAHNHDGQALQKKIGSYMKSFMDKAGQAKLDDRAIRRLKIFALCYAVGRLAKKWGVLDQNHFGGFEKPLLRAWTIAEGGVIKDDREIFFNYLRKHVEKITEVDSKNRPELSNEEFSKAKAYICRQRDGQLLACFPTSRMVARFPGFEKLWKKLRTKGQIIADSGLQSGQRIRLVNGKVKKEKVYALRIEAWPLP